jgi:hypothetical protein
MATRRSRRAGLSLVPASEVGYGRGALLHGPSGVGKSELLGVGKSELLCEVLRAGGLSAVHVTPDMVLQPEKEKGQGERERFPTSSHAVAPGQRLAECTGAAQRDAASLPVTRELDLEDRLAAVLVLALARELDTDDLADEAPVVEEGRQPRSRKPRHCPAASQAARARQARPPSRASART